MCVCVSMCMPVCECACTSSHTAILYLCIIFCDILKATEGEEMELPGMEICEHFGAAGNIWSRSSAAD